MIKSPAPFISQGSAPPDAEPPRRPKPGLHPLPDEQNEGDPGRGSRAEGGDRRIPTSKRIQRAVIVQPPVISRTWSSRPVISHRMRETGISPEASISSMKPLMV